jgi:hypothetical protein
LSIAKSLQKKAKETKGISGLGFWDAHLDKFPFARVTLNFGGGDVSVTEESKENLNRRKQRKQRGYQDWGFGMLIWIGSRLRL